MDNKTYKLAYFVTHPIQYQAPLLRKLAEQPEIELKVFFLCDPASQKYVDTGFGTQFTWDISLLDGYVYEIFDSLLGPGDIGWSNPKVPFAAVKRALFSEKWDAVWFHGYINKALFYGIWLCQRKAIPYFFRAESNLCCTSTGIIKDFIIRCIVQRADGLLWIGSDNRDYYRHYGAKEEQLFFVPYAVDNQFFQKTIRTLQAEDCREDKLKDDYRLIHSNKDRAIILYASKFIRRKHSPMLLEAFCENDLNAELWFIGDGEDRPVLEQMITDKKYGKKIKLLGFKNQTELPSYYARCDLFVLPSEQEPFGLIINEVMNAGKAVLTTDEVGAARDLIKNGENGWVIKAGDQAALSQALKNAVADPKRLEQMGMRSLEIINKWSYDQDICGIMAALKR